MKKGFLFVAGLAALLSAACSTPYLRSQDAAIREKNQFAKEAQAVNERTVEQAQTLRVPSVVVTEKTYLGVKPVPLSSAPKPPAFLSRRVQVAQEVTTIFDMADVIAAIAKTPVTIADDARFASPRTTSPGGGAGASAGAGPSGGSGGGSGSDTRIALNYSGTLSGLLDIAATRFGVSWRYVQTGAIEFFFKETRTFPLMVLPGKIDIKTDVGTSGGGSASAGGGAARTASQSTRADVSAEFWKDLENSIKAIMTTAGAVSMSPSAGTVTVTDTPAALDRIAKLIESQNSLLTKQVLLDVKVVNLSLKNREQLGIDWSLVYTSLGQNVLKTATSGIDPTLTSQVTAGVNNLVFSVTGDGRRLQGSDAILKALNEQANIGTVTSAQQFALNNQATPIQVGLNSRFIESITSQSQGVGIAPTITINTNSISSGVALQLLPRIIDNQNLLIHFSVDISDDPEGLDTLVNGVSLYKQVVRNFMQRVSLRTGETLVLSGYEKNTNSTTKQGVANPDNPLFGGKRDAEAKREIIVIMITPVIMDRVRS